MEAPLGQGRSRASCVAGDGHLLAGFGGGLARLREAVERCLSRGEESG